MNNGPYMSWWVDALGILFIIFILAIAVGVLPGYGWVSPWAYFPG